MKKILITVLVSVSIYSKAQERTGAQYAYEAEKIVDDEASDINVLKQAISLFENAEAKGFGDAYMYHQKGYCFYRIGEHASAVAAFTMSISRMGKDVSKELGREMFRRQNLYSPVGKIEQSFVLKQEPCDTYYRRGLSKAILKDLKGAEKDLDVAIRKCPDRDGLYYQLRGQVKGKLGNVNEACEDFSRAGELGVEVAYDYIRDYCQ
ncbi:MAG: hypothetical protein K9J06_13195 [Flavobacteriales bacterium]|nr:hypothetical protein [Flavobacteriales bacterium]